MNYDLAIMALEGLGKSPLMLRADATGITIEGSQASFKELARLCLLMGSPETGADETIELQTGVHLRAGSSGLRLRIGGGGGSQ